LHDRILKKNCRRFDSEGGILMSEPVRIYKKQYHIDLGDVDFQKRLKISSMFNYFQDIASLHVENLGVGIDTLINRYGVTWILTRMRVDIEKVPVLGEDILVETWPQIPKRVEFDRDFLIRDAAGNPVVRAASTWIILDVKTRELKKSDAIPSHYPFTPPERAIDCRLGRFKAHGTPEVAYEKVIGYSDVDFNEHLNNTKYIDFIMDCFSLDEHRRYDIKSLEIDYINEALPGDRLTLYRDLSAYREGIVYVEGLNQNDVRSFKSQLLIRPREA